MSDIDCENQLDKVLGLFNDNHDKRTDQMLSELFVPTHFIKGASSEIVLSRLNITALSRMIVSRMHFALNKIFMRQRGDTDFSELKLIDNVKNYSEDEYYLIEKNCNIDFMINMFCNGMNYLKRQDHYYIEIMN